MKFIFVSLLLCVLSFSASAQEKRLDSSPRDFRVFFSQFKKSVEKSDKTAVVLVTSFPFKYGFDAGDEGTMTKAQFLKSYEKRFAESLKEAVKEENPVFAESKKNVYVVSTEDAAHLIFIKRDGGYKFFSYIVEP